MIQININSKELQANQWSTAILLTANEWHTKKELVRVKGFIVGGAIVLEIRDWSEGRSMDMCICVNQPTSQSVY